MIKQLFKSSVFCTSMLVALMLLAVSGFNDVKAQTRTLTTTAVSGGLSQSEMQAFKTELKAMIADAETNQIYGQVERAIRLDLYDNIRVNVINGYSIENAIDTGMKATYEFARLEFPSHTVNIRQLGEQAKSRLL